ncbi:MAG: DUF1295 domain-containing protein [Anaerolineae bacterium]
MSFLQIYGMGAGGILALMVVLWIVSLIMENASIVDIFWGPGFVLANWIYFALGDGAVTRSWFISILVTIWGLRLGGYILWRNSGKGEDFRYRRWREESMASWWWASLFKIFLLQGLLMWIVSAPLVVVHAAGGPTKLIWLDGIAVALWGAGFLFEAIGDLQLARFKVDPANEGQVLDRGLWRYTRHPNYFGDAVQWWAYYLIAIVSGGAWTIFSPILMTVLLVRVSGAALLERSLKDTKPAYREYIESTSAFVPWFPRQEGENGEE